MLYTKRMAA